jgi:hypothetical protein
MRSMASRALGLQAAPLATLQRHLRSGLALLAYSLSTAEWNAMRVLRADVADAPWANCMGEPWRLPLRAKVMECGDESPHSKLLIPAS